MTTQRCLSALVVTLLLAGCSDVTTIPEPNAPNALVLNRRSASLVTAFDLPVEYPTGLASDGSAFLYLSTGSLFRETHKINRQLQLDVGVIPTGGNPRDVTFDGTNLLFSDLSNRVDKRDVLGNLIDKFALPFNGAGIATDGDTIWVGDFNTNQMIVTADFGASYATYPTAVRMEGAVFDASSKTLWALTPFPGDNKIYEMTTTGVFIRECETKYEGGPSGLGGIALVPPDTFYIAEPKNGDPTQGTTILIFLKSDLVCTPALVQKVEIEVKPHGGGDPDRIRPASNGEVRVAIWTTPAFNAASVDATSVRFGHSGTEAAAVHVAMRDADRDGDVDMVLRFRIQDTGIQCGDTEAVLTGKANFYQAIRGSDAIRTVGCRHTP